MKSSLRWPILGLLLAGCPSLVLAEDSCGGRWQEVATRVPGSKVALTLSTTKEGEERLQWPMVISAQFDSAAPSAEGPAVVSFAEEITVREQFGEPKVAHHRYGRIDEKGQVVIQPQFETAGDCPGSWVIQGSAEQRLNDWLNADAQGFFFCAPARHGQEFSDDETAIDVIWSRMRPSVS